MEFVDTPEQADLRDAAAAFARRYATPERVRAAMAGPAGYDQETWRRLSGDLGLTALAVPEQHGGMGAGAAEVAVAAQRARPAAAALALPVHRRRRSRAGRFVRPVPGRR